MNSKQQNHTMNKAFRIFLAAALLVAALGIAPVPVAHAATRTVCSSGCDHTTIAAAITAASDDDIINVTDATHTEAGITVNKNLTIQGQGASSTTVQADATEGSATDRVFTISSGKTVTIKDMTIQHGKVTGSPAQGGGIKNDGTLTLQRVTVTANRAQSDDGEYEGENAQGGGIYNNGTLTVEDSTISSNTAQGGNATGDYGMGGAAYGGGIANELHKTLTATDSTISSNTARGGNATEEGGIAYGGGFTTPNVGGDTGTVTFTNCTISGNSAIGGTGSFGNGYGRGGGLAGPPENGFLKISFCTIAGGNSASEGGGLYSTTSVDNTGPIIKNTIIGDNTATSSGPDICYRVQSRGYNLVENTNGGTLDTSGGGNTGTGNITGQDPALDTLRDNGSPQTHALLPGSPAIDAGSSTDIDGNTVTADQRGEGRSVDYDRNSTATCDIGSFELQSDENDSSSTFPNTFGATLVQITVNSGDPGTVTVTKNNQPAGGGDPDENEMPIYWNITASGSSYNLDLKLCYTDWEVGQGNNVTEADLKIYRWSGSTWVDMSGTVDVDRNYVIKSGVTQLSDWTLGDGPPNGGPTAVTLARFTARPGVETWFPGETGVLAALALVALGAVGASLPFVSLGPLRHAPGCVPCNPRLQPTPEFLDSHSLYPGTDAEAFPQSAWAIR
jgi:hypothetical protein